MLIVPIQTAGQKLAMRLTGLQQGEALLVLRNSRIPYQFGYDVLVLYHVDGFFRHWDRILYGAVLHRRCR